MAWEVVLHDEFALEFERMTAGIQDELLAHALLLRDYGPGLGRPAVDTIKASKHANLKELRFSHGKAVWRVAFAFDPVRKAVLLVAGNKVGADQKLFYKRLIDIADRRLTQHLSDMKPGLKTVFKEKQHGKKN